MNKGASGLHLDKPGKGGRRGGQWRASLNTKPEEAEKSLSPGTALQARARVT